MKTPQELDDIKQEVSKEIMKIANLIQGSSYSRQVYKIHFALSDHLQGFHIRITEDAQEVYSLLKSSLPTIMEYNEDEEYFDYLIRDLKDDLKEVLRMVKKYNK